MYIIFFDLFAFIISLFTLFLYFIHKAHNLLKNRIFLIVLLSIIFGSFFAFTSSILINKLPTSNATLIIVITTFYYIFNQSSLPLFALYIRSETSNKDPSNFFKVLFYMPWAIALTLIFINLFTGIVFYVNVDSVYSYGPLFIVQYFLSVSYIFVIARYLLVNKSMMLKTKRTTTFAFLLIASLILYLQNKISGLVLETFTSAVASLFLFLLVYRPKQTKDFVTGAFSRKTFELILSNLTKKNEEFDVLIVYSPDIKELQGFLDYNAYKKLVVTFFTWVQSKIPKESPISLLDEGAFGVIIQKNQIELPVQFLLLEFLERAYSVWDIDFIQLELTLQAGVLSYPTNFKNLAEANDRISGILKVSELLGNRHVFYATDIAPGAYTQKAKIIEGLNSAISSKIFDLEIQQIHSVNDNQNNIAEVTFSLLIDNDKRVYQKEILPLAEEIGLSKTLGDSILKQACACFVKTNGLDGAIKKIQIKLFDSQTFDVKWYEEIEAIIKSSGINPSKIQLGITETTISSSKESLLEGMHYLKTQGIQFYIDNYGTGYTDLRRIPALPVSYIKIDELIVRDGIQNSKSMHILTGTIHYLKNFNFQIVANGIQTKEHADMLVWAGCEYLQGAFYEKVRYCDY